MGAEQLLVSDAEVRFERRRRLVGIFGAPLTLILVLAFAPSNLKPEAARMLALLFATLVLWVTEAIPVAMTAVLAPSIAVLMGIGSAERMFAAFGNPLLFLFMGAFFLAQAAERTRLDRVLAARLFPTAETSPERTLISTTLVTAGISSLFSNAATTAMMVPVIRAAVDRFGPRAQSVGILSAAFASSIGGVLTPIGTPPNLLAIAALTQYAHKHVPFFKWTLIALPMAAAVLGVWIVILLATVKTERKRLHTAGRTVSDEPMPTDLLRLRTGDAVLWGLDRGQAGTLAVIVLAGIGWMTPGVLDLVLGSQSPAYLWCKAALPEGVVAIVCATLLFLLPAATRVVAGVPRPRPVLVWAEATQIDWGTLLLFGGGVALGEQVFSTGLSNWIGELVLHATQVKSEWGLVILFSTVSLVLSEFTSNTATAAMTCPLAVMTAQQLGVSPVAPCIAASLASSMGFLLPISTAPNAIVYGSGKVPLRTMMKNGIWLDLTGLIVIPPTVMVMTRLVGLR